MLLALQSGCQQPETSPPPPPDWRSLAVPGEPLGGFLRTSFGGEGEVQYRGEEGWILDFGSPLTGIHWPGDFPLRDYELRVVAARLLGTDFFCGLTFPIAASHLTLIVGGWGGALVGLSCIDGRDASANATRQFHSFEQGLDHEIRVRVAGTRVQVWLEAQSIMDIDVSGHTLSLRPEVWPSRPLGIAAYATRARIRSIEWREILSSP